MSKKKIVNFILYIITYLFIIISLKGTIDVYAASGSIKNFKIPLYTTDMQDKGFVKGKSADFVDSVTIDIREAVAEYILPATKRKWLFKTNRCVFLKEKNIIRTDDFVQIEGEGIFIDGKGLFWDIKDDKMTIKKNVTVDFDRNLFKSSGEGNEKNS